MKFLPKLTLKQLMWIFILTLLSMFLHIWYMNRLTGFVGDFTRFLTETRNNFLQDYVPPPPHTKHVLFWNGYQGNMIDQTLKCTPPGDSCIYKAKSKNKEVDDIFVSAIIFNERSLNWSDIPKKRWENQLYIFWCTEPSLTAPECKSSNNSFFNWTFTYLLDSTVSWNYFVVQERKTNAIVAPNKSVIWKDNDDPIKPYLKNVLSKKTKPIAWVTSNCKMNNGSMYMYDLHEELKRIDLSIDVYGPCSNKSCTNNDCDKMVKKDYYFYIAIEDYLAEDFVSSKVLGAYNNFAVPIVYGGADYRWFLPPGSYLDGKEMHPHSLAFAVKIAIENPEEVYASYFQWRNIYSIDGYQEGCHPLCTLCAAMNANMK